MKRFKSHLEILEKGIIILGAIFALYQYLELKSQSKISQTMTFFSRLNEEDAFVRRQRLLNVSLGASKYLGSDGAIEAAFLSEYIGDYLSLGKYPGGTDTFKADIIFYVDNIEELLVCVENNICDEKTADRFVLDSYRTFFCFFGAEIERIGNSLGNKEFGKRASIKLGSGCNV